MNLSNHFGRGFQLLKFIGLCRHWEGSLLRGKWEPRISDAPVDE